MKNNKHAIVIRSQQLNKDSLVLASLGASTFLDFLLSNIAQAFPDTQKIFAMEFADLQEISEKQMKAIADRGFEVVIGDKDYIQRMITVAKQFDLDHIIDVPVIYPLLCVDVVKGMLDSHIKSDCAITICRNLPPNLSSTVVCVDALELFQAHTDPGFLNYYNIEDQFKKRITFSHFMVNNPTHYKVNTYSYPLNWQGRIKTFEDNFTSLHLGRRENLDTLRNIVYTINDTNITPDNIIDVGLIKNMQAAWTQPNQLDTKYIVADQAGWTDDDKYEKAAVEEVDWFVLKDDIYLDGRPIKKQNILEVGCGHGRLVRVLSGSFGQVFGTDATADRFREARFRCREIPNIIVTNNDGRSLKQYENDFFDFTFAHGVFVHINSKGVINNYIAEMARVLKQNGRLKFDVYFGQDSFGVTATTFGLGARYTEEEIKEIFSKNGIKLVNIEHVVTRQFSRTGTEYSLPLAQMLVIGEKE